MKTLDLFSGPGGLTLGLKQAGVDVVAAIEHQKDAMDTYISHTPEGEHLNVDVRTVDFTRFKNKVDLVCGGPPCQPFSFGGLRKSNADERNMIPEFLRCIHECNPPFFILENVPGLITKKTRAYFEQNLLEFEQLGYRINWSVLYSPDYGIPQKRRRLFILGSKVNPLLFPVPTHGPTTNLSYLTSGDYLSESPIGTPPNSPVRYAKSPDLRLSPYAGHLYNGGGRPIDLNAPCHTILASSGGYKTHWVDTESIAPEYHAHLKSGGKPRQGIVPGARRLSTDECAIIQTFPRNVKFFGSQSSQYTQIGDAVPPKLSNALGKCILAQINGIDSDLLPLNPECKQIQHTLFV